jgi:fibronectin type 3 domain-containing protein
MGAFTARLTVTDPEGLTASATYSLTVTDTTPPTVPGNLRASVTVKGKKATSASVALSWNASTDNVGVWVYRVFRNGVQLSNGITTSPSYVDPVVPLGVQSTYYVVAVDAAANVSAASNSVTVRP